MADEEYEEPTNEQLANFLIVYAPQIVGMQEFALNPDILKELMDRDPRYRAGALRHHKKFVKEMADKLVKMEKGQLQCEHIRTNGRRCPNWNEPGQFFCGLHLPEEEEDGGSDIPQ